MFSALHLGIQVPLVFNKAITVAGLIEAADAVATDRSSRRDVDHVASPKPNMTVAGWVGGSQ